MDKIAVTKRETIYERAKDIHSHLKKATVIFVLMTEFGINECHARQTWERANIYWNTLRTEYDQNEKNRGQTIMMKPERKRNE